MTESEGPDILPKTDIATLHQFQKAGVGVCEDELVRTCLAIRQLSDDLQLENARFWGKILGLKNNYFVVECEALEKEETEEKEEQVSEHEVHEDTKEGKLLIIFITSWCIVVFIL